jgi:hypothetical protein
MPQTVSVVVKPITNKEDHDGEISGEGSPEGFDTRKGGTYSWPRSPPRSPPRPRSTSATPKRPNGCTRCSDANSARGRNVRPKSKAGPPKGPVLAEAHRSKLAGDSEVDHLAATVTRACSYFEPTKGRRAGSRARWGAVMILLPRSSPRRSQPVRRHCRPQVSTERPPPGGGAPG